MAKKNWVSEEQRGRYYASREWALRKNAIRSRCDGLCEHCFSHPMQQTHHLTYERFGREHLVDLMGVCEQCHKYLSGKDDKPSKLTPLGSSTSAKMRLVMTKQALLLIDHPELMKYCLWLADDLWAVDFRQCYRIGENVEHTDAYDSSLRPTFLVPTKDISVGNPVFIPEFPWLLNVRLR